MTVKVGGIETPEFQGTHLWNRLGWAKENLEMVRSDIVLYGKTQINQKNQKGNTQTQLIRVRYKVDCNSIFLLGTQKDENTYGFVKHTRGKNFYNMKPIDAMTEEEIY